jgi:AcrR family transcriptional regulator
MQIDDSTISGEDTEGAEPPRGTRKEQWDRTHAALLDAAAVEFSIRGVAGAVAADIIRRAGVSKGSFRHHFVTKENIAAELIEGKYDIWPDVLAGVRARPLRGLAAIREIILQVAVHARDDVRVRAAMRITREVNAGEPYPKPFLRWEEAFIAFLQQALVDRDLAEDTNLAKTARVLVECGWGVMQVAGESGTSDRIEELLDEVWEPLFRGLKAANEPDLPL